MFLAAGTPDPGWRIVETAMHIGAALGTSAELWLRMEDRGQPRVTHHPATTP